MFAVSFRRVSGSFKSVNDQNDVFKLFTGEDKNYFTAKDVERVLGKLNYK